MNIGAVSLGLAYNLTHYKDSSYFDALKQEGHARDMGMAASFRLFSLFNQMNWQSLAENFGAQLGAVVAHLVIATAKPRLESYLEEHREESSWKIKSVRVLSKIANLEELFIKNSDTLINVAAAIAYVASIVFGWSILTGGLGLAGLLFIALKKQGVIPAGVDRLLQPICFVAELATRYTMPIHPILRVLYFVPVTLALLSYLKSSGDPLAGFYQPKEVDLKGFEEKSAWSIDKSHIYAYHPDKVDGYRGRVHQQLAKKRSFAIDNIVKRMLKNSAFTKTFPSLFENEAKSLKQGLEEATAYRLRSHQGVVYQKETRTHLLTAVLIKRCLNKQPDLIGKIDKFYLTLTFAFREGLQPVIAFCDEIFEEIEEELTDVDGVVREIFCAIKEKKIAWEAIEEWIKEVKLKITFDPSTYIATTEDGSLYLTEAGTQLLLADMSILI